MNVCIYVTLSVCVSIRILGTAIHISSLLLLILILVLRKTLSLYEAGTHLLSQGAWTMSPSALFSTVQSADDSSMWQYLAFCLGIGGNLD